MTDKILSPKTARDLLDDGAHYELGVRGSTKVGFGPYVSFIELAPISLDGEVRGWVWLCRDESADTVDFIEAAEADQAAAEGYTALEG